MCVCGWANGLVGEWVGGFGGERGVLGSELRHEGKLRHAVSHNSDITSKTFRPLIEYN